MRPSSWQQLWGFMLKMRGSFDSVTGVIRRYYRAVCKGPVREQPPSAGQRAASCGPSVLAPLTWPCFPGGGGSLGSPVGEGPVVISATVEDELSTR